MNKKTETIQGENIKGTKSWFFEKKSTKMAVLARVTRKKKRFKFPKSRMKKGTSPTNLIEIKRILRE